MDYDQLPEPSPMSSWPTVLLWTIGVVASTGIVLAVIFAPGPPPVNPELAQKVAPVDDVPDYQFPTDDVYVGSQRCAGCHGKISESFKSHPMANSAALVSQSTVSLEQLKQTRVVGKQRVLDVELRGDELIHHERMFDAEGKQIYDQAVPMKFEVGSGRRAKAFVHQRGEALFMSPLNWYSNPGMWGLAPNYDLDDDRRFDRRVTDECLGCHTGRLNVEGRSLNLYKTPVFHELTIGCENCHGAGSQHVAFHEGGGTGDDPIINPAELDRTRRESVCNQCHLLTAVRINRYKRSHLDFRPGDNFDDIWTALDTHLGVTADGRTRAVNHVQQMQESQCYVKSAGQFGCTSCHDPHGVPAAAERSAFYRQRCAQCHQEGACSAPLEQRQAQDNSCIACHMPTRDSKNISHVTQTDHRVLRQPHLGTGTQKQPDGEELTLMRTSDVPLEDWEQQRALGLGAWIYLSKADRKPPQILARNLLRVLQKVRDDGDILLALGAMATQHGITDRAREYYEAGRKIPSAEEESLEGLLSIYYSAAKWEIALQCADRLLQINPGYAKGHAMRADILLNLGRREEGIQAALRALEFNPTLIPVREWLIQAYDMAGRTKERTAQEEILRRMRDARPPA